MRIVLCGKLGVGLNALKQRLKYLLYTLYFFHLKGCKQKTKYIKQLPKVILGKFFVVTRLSIPRSILPKIKFIKG